MTIPRIAVTGAGGFLGWHLRVRAHATGEAATVAIDRMAMANDDVLDTAVRGCDAVVHVAGVNRGSDPDVEGGNERLARRLTASLRRCESQAMVVYANTIHADRDTPYGRSKAVAAAILDSWAGESDARFIDVRLPNLFGEHGRPDYNSVVATFCRRLADDVEPDVQGDAELRLLHVQQAADYLLALACGGLPGHGFRGELVTVRQLLDVLRRQRETYRHGDIPAFANELELDLFNTLRSALFPSAYPLRPVESVDQRGALHECVRSHGTGGQTFVSTTVPGQTRGEHYHLRKIERFHVLQGTAEIALRRLLTNEVVRFRVEGGAPALIDMPTLWVHNIRNVGEGDLMTLFWADQLYDQERPDTYREPVGPEAPPR